MSASLVRELLLTRRGLAFLDSASGSNDRVDAHVLQALELELADLGYVISTRLRARVARASLDEVVAFRAFALAGLAKHLGGGRKHEPLFRSFPDGIPRDTMALWWQRVLSHFLQGEGQPCLFCHRTGTTHVLNPCHHVVCDHCFDGSNYSGCPVCGAVIERPSPFVRAIAPREKGDEQITFKLLDVGEDEASEARAWFASLCARKQALSPDDREALTAIVSHYRAAVLAWVPGAIPVRENVAIVIGVLFRELEPLDVLPAAQRFLTSATDVLRVLAVYSGADASLQGEKIFKQVAVDDRTNPFWNALAKFLGGRAVHPSHRNFTVPVTVHRFKLGKLRRPLRRALLALLDALDPERLVEDFLRNDSYWIWIGEFLHPHEYARRYPNVARAFAIVRKKAPDGTQAPPFATFASRVEKATAERDLQAAVELLATRPGELGRKLDHLLRIADAQQVEIVVSTLARKASALATPMLLTLRSHLGARTERARVRVYWPKGSVAVGVVAADERPPLAPVVVERAAGVIDAELLRRFAEKPAFDSAVIDDALRNIPVPFNERTSSPSAVGLPRGARVAVHDGKIARMFIHWCEPEKGGARTDIDLSVGFYDEDWKHVGVCSYYQLVQLGTGGSEIAKSSGDFTSAPFPDGASEFVDLHRDRALAEGYRYAVMVVNNYAGLPFSRLERGFAGLMLRDDDQGLHFDPRTVTLRFSMGGENGVFIPLVFDLRECMLHWLDVHAKGALAMNNVAGSNRAITTICPNLITYFASGTRPSMFELALLHAAARCRRVLLRGETTRLFVRRPDEDAVTFLGRLQRDDSDEPRSRMPTFDRPVLAALHNGNLGLPPGSVAYALFREQIATSISAADLLS